MNDAWMKGAQIPMCPSVGHEGSASFAEVTVDPLYSSRREVILVYVTRLIEDPKFEAYYNVFKEGAVGLFKALIRSLRHDNGSYSEHLSIATCMDSVRGRLSTLLETTLGDTQFLMEYRQAARNDQRAAFSKPDDVKIDYPSHVLSLPPELFSDEQFQPPGSMRSFSIFANFKETLASEDHSSEGRFQATYRNDQHLYDVLWTLLCQGVELSQNPRIFDENWKPMSYTRSVGDVQGEKLFILLDRPKGLMFGSRVFGSIYRVSKNPDSSFVLKQPLGTLFYIHNTPNNVLANYGGVSISGPVSYVLQRVLEDDRDNWAVESEDTAYVIPGNPTSEQGEGVSRGPPSSLSSSVSSSASPPSPHHKNTNDQFTSHPWFIPHRPSALAFDSSVRRLRRALQREPLNNLNSVQRTPSPLSITRPRHDSLHRPNGPVGARQRASILAAIPKRADETLTSKRVLVRPNQMNQRSLISASRPLELRKENISSEAAGSTQHIIIPELPLAPPPPLEARPSTSCPATSALAQTSGASDSDSPIQGPSATSSFGSIINCYSRASSSGRNSPHVLSATSVHTEVTRTENNGVVVINNFEQKFYIRRGDTFNGAIHGGTAGGRRNLNTVSEVLNA
ncbi:hypothetical protein ONZ45_g5313 [Pleurotus djamor]|nr:hypothetical protein ONZ45_g5313 [Pleurotus djamor]